MKFVEILKENYFYLDTWWHIYLRYLGAIYIYYYEAFFKSMYGAYVPKLTTERFMILRRCGSSYLLED
jgi:hypothetical protein